MELNFTLCKYLNQLGLVVVDWQAELDLAHGNPSVAHLSHQILSAILRSKLIIFTFFNKILYPYFLAESRVS